MASLGIQERRRPCVHTALSNLEYGSCKNSLAFHSIDSHLFTSSTSFWRAKLGLRDPIPLIWSHSGPLIFCLTRKSHVAPDCFGVFIYDKFIDQFHSCECVRFDGKLKDFYELHSDKWGSHRIFCYKSLMGQSSFKVSKFCLGCRTASIWENKHDLQNMSIPSYSAWNHTLSNIL